MLNKIVQNKGTIFIFFILVSLLAGVRAFESQLFYDPFLVYFKKDYLKSPLPEFDSFLMFLGLLFRFFLNTVLSLAILYNFFRDKEMLQFASALYLFFFVILIITFFCFLFFYGNENNLVLFYIRRFLIQPIFIILFIPAFYYQKKYTQSA
jgi:exosortase F-associated protein